MPEVQATDSILATTSTTATLAIGASDRGYINTGGDHDWRAVSLLSGHTYTFTADGMGVGAVQDTVIALRDSAGNLLVSDDDSGPLAGSLLTYTASASGTFYLDVSAYSGAATGQYMVTAAEGTARYEPVVSLQDQADYLTNTYWEVNGGHDRKFASNSITFDVSALEPERAALARIAFGRWADVANLTFTEVTSGGNIVFDDNQTGAYSSSSTSGNTILSSSINVYTGWYGGIDAVDSYTLQTFIHEIGHSLGLGHFGPYNGSATYGTDNVFANDSWQYSVMSYMAQSNYDGGSYRFTMTPMLADIVAIQSMYGSVTTHNGNDVYGFNETAGDIFDFSSYGSAPALTIYDTGGTDTLDCSGYSSAQRIDLTGGSFSNIGGLTHNVAITAGSVIENAVGGSGNDVLIGNSAANTLNGGAGNDAMYGGAGNDTYYVDFVGVGYGDSANENANEGSDTVYSSVTYTLPTNVEALILTGSSNLDATGNSADNALVGNSGNNNLVGLGGADYMVGGAGNDTYYVENAGDAVVENASEGNDVVHSTITWTIGANVESLVLDGTATNGDGNSADNALIGNASANILDGKAGIDYMAGGAGDDIYYVDNVSDAVAENASEGNDIVHASVHYTLAANVESLVFDGSANLIGAGNSADNALIGNSGANNLDGGAGADYMQGGTGADTIAGGSGNDFLYGNVGTGGDSAIDTFVFGDTWGTDHVYDFEHGIDVLDLSAVTGVNVYSDLSVSNVSGDAYVTFGGNAIVVHGLGGVLTSSDFIL